MKYKSWIPLQSVINEGPDFVFEDQDIWLEPLKEFAVPCRISKPIRAEISIFPQAEGLLASGRFTGQVVQPCSRCNEDAVADLEHNFESFEPFPEEKAEGKSDEKDVQVDEFFVRYSPKGLGLEINMAALLWEEFAQALPVRPLCSDSCAGLCGKCGQNLNTGKCGCVCTADDPRMAALHGLKLKK